MQIILFSRIWFYLIYKKNKQTNKQYFINNICGFIMTLTNWKKYIYFKKTKFDSTVTCYIFKQNQAKLKWPWEHTYYRWQGSKNLPSSNDSNPLCSLSSIIDQEDLKSCTTSQYSFPCTWGILINKKTAYRCLKCITTCSNIPSIQKLFDNY